MKNLACALTIVSFVGAMGWYIPLVLRRRVSPAPATWIIGCLAMVLAVASFHAMPGRTVTANITLYAAAFEITVVTAIIMVVLWQSGELRISFDWIQKSCLVVMNIVLAYWAVEKDHPDVPFWSMQVLLVVAYAATISKAIQTRSAFDSIGNWSLIMAGGLIGTIPAVLEMSPYGIGNSVRAVVSSSITVGVLIYFDSLKGHARWHDELATLKQFYRLS